MNANTKNMLPLNNNARMRRRAIYGENGCLVDFEPKEHTYVYKPTGEMFRSVTRVISQFYPFRKESVITNVVRNPKSRYYRWAYHEVEQYWQEVAMEGTLLHNAIEAFYGHFPQIVGDDKGKAVKRLSAARKVARILPEGEVLCETLLWDADLGIAGACDFIVDTGDKLLIFDTKTSRRMDSEKKRKYALQFELYAYMLEKISGRAVEVGGMVWFEDWVNNMDVDPVIMAVTPDYSIFNKIVRGEVEEDILFSLMG